MVSPVSAGPHPLTCQSRTYSARCGAALAPLWSPRAAGDGRNMLRPYGFGSGRSLGLMAVC